MDGLLVGLAIGLAAGVSPGPLLALVVGETLRSGRTAGLLAAAAPLLSDLLVVGGVLLVLSHLPSWVLPALGVLGGAYVIHTGLGLWRESGDAAQEVPQGMPSAQVLGRAALVNLLSPHPWITWATALGPLVVTTWHRTHQDAMALVVGFYLTLVGAKMALAVVVDRGRSRLGGAGYRRALRGAALLLVVAGVVLVVEFGPRLLR